MIKFVMCMTRHPEMSREQFKEYWKNSHGPFFMRNADAMGATKYVQSHTLDSPLNEGLRSSRGMLPEYDGVAEVWFESEEALVQAMSSPEGQKLNRPKTQPHERHQWDWTKQLNCLYSALIHSTNGSKFKMSKLLQRTILTLRTSFSGWRIFLKKQTNPLKSLWKRHLITWMRNTEHKNKG